MNPQLEKILKMLEMEAVKVRESDDFAQIDFLKLEVERFIKTEYAKILQLREQLILEALNGEEEGQVGNYLVTYKSTERFAMDNQRLKQYVYSNILTKAQREEIDDLSKKEQDEYITDVIKSMFYSQSSTKPTIKLKNK